MAIGLHNKHCYAQSDLTKREVRRAARVGLRGGRNRKYTLAELLAARTVKGPSCWICTGHPGKARYPHISSKAEGKCGVLAHRLAWELAYGPIPTGERVCHRCDNPCCVNPDHLFLGSQKENIHDCIRKGRRNAWGRQKLHETDVLAIRARVAAGELQKAVARAFGVKHNTISGIVNGHSWKHLLPAVELPVFERVPHRLVPVIGELRCA